MLVHIIRGKSSADYKKNDCKKKRRAVQLLSKTNKDRHYKVIYIRIL
jgi:hypothetical protein